jgi:hypothetical protein
MSATSQAEDRLTLHGLSRREARALVRAMRRDVARRSGDLLPEVVYSVAPGLFLGGQRVLPEVLEEAVDELMLARITVLPGSGMARYSVVPGIVLDPVAIGWIDHASRRRLGQTSTSRPVPGRALRQYREDCQEGIAEGTATLEAVPPPFDGRVSLVFYSAIAMGIGEEEARVRALEWTGWALLAVMMALQTHEDKVPFPDRREDEFTYARVKEAFHKGQALLVAGGLQLIHEAERELA